MSSSLLAPTAPDLSSGVFSEGTGRDVAVSVRGLSKSYSIAHAAKHTTAGEALMHTLKNPFARAERETFWALQDVSFDVHQGDVVGIIGRNGAGKSTLLKILSRITEPTAGQIDLYGRVGSLLEVGTGFHPELTGRENVYLNGAILGMKRAEIARQFDAIIDFSGTEQFLDTPVKRYSSGMYVRLAFAVAAHLNPEILIVDEVLAVGDAEFQKKCLGKMKDVARSGRTVLFVSHNMAAVRQLCTSAIALKNGRMTRQGGTEEIIVDYLTGDEVVAAHWETNKHGIQLREVTLRDVHTGHSTQEPLFNGEYQLQVNLSAQAGFSGGSLICEFRDSLGTLVSSLCTLEEGISALTFNRGCDVRFVLPHLQLFPNVYKISIRLCRPNDPETYLSVDNALSLTVQPAHVQEGAWPYRGLHGFVRLSKGATADYR